MKRKGIIALIFIILAIILVFLGRFVIRNHVTNTQKASKPVSSNPEKTQAQASKKDSPSAGPQPSTLTPNTFAQLQTVDQKTIRDLVQQVRRLGDPQATPADCSLLTLKDAHYAITSFWDPKYIRDPNIWKAPATDNLWDPSLKTDILKPGAWMIAMLTESKESNLPGVALRWGAPPDNLLPPPVSSTEPVAQACNLGWNELLKQHDSFFSFVKATAVQNKLQLHFTVVKVDKPEKIVVTIPINGTYKAWSLGKVSIQDE